MLFVSESYIYIHIYIILIYIHIYIYEFSLLRSSHHWIRVSVQVPNTHSRSECSVNFLTNVFIRSLCIYSFLYYFFMFKAIMVILLICCKWTRLNVCEIRVRTKYVITYVALNCCVQNIRIFRFSLQAYILIYIYIYIHTHTLRI